MHQGRKDQASHPPFLDGSIKRSFVIRLVIANQTKASYSRFDNFIHSVTTTASHPRGAVVRLQETPHAH